MARRITPLVTGEHYHVYNRGVARQPVFLTKRNLSRFITTLSYYRFAGPPIKLSRLLRLPTDERERFKRRLSVSDNSLVEIISFALMPNHFHLLLKQVADRGITDFISRVVNSYTRYFNTAHTRVGPVFQGTFKAVHIEADEQMIHLSRYIHLNPLVSHLVEESVLATYPWSSLPAFLTRDSTLINTEAILRHFTSPQEYKKFVFDHVDYAKNLEMLKHLKLE